MKGLRMIVARTACLAALASLCSSAFADPPVPDTVTVAAVHAASAGTEPRPDLAYLRAIALPDAALDPSELGDLRGGEIVVVQGSSQNLSAVNSGNTVSGMTVDSGAMNINANAFNGYEGIGNFVINTGHNNNLMGSVSVNVMVTPQ
jgi:hypothetical protein